MADISKLNLNNSLYNIKDSTARTNVSNLENSLGTASGKDYATVAIGTTGEDVNALPSVGQIETYVSNKVSGAMHFKGVVLEPNLPPASGYDAGDVIIYNNKEYVCYEDNQGKDWEQLGDESTLYATQTELRQAEGVGWTSASTVQGNADAITTLQTTVGNQGTAIDSLEDAVDAIESWPASSITSAKMQTWDSKQPAITDGSATIANTDSEGNIILYNVTQTNGSISASSSSAATLSKVASTGDAKDLNTDSTHRLVTDAQITAWDSGTGGYITSVDTEFNVDNNGKLEFASGYNALTDTEQNKLSGISNGANQVTVPNEGAGTISIDGVNKNIALPNTVQDANYRHIDVTETSVTAVATDSAAAVTFNKYVHPTGTGASKSLDLYKISTDGTSHIASATAVTGADIAGYLNFITAYDATNNKIATASDIAGGVHFKGVYASKEDIDFTPETGDMIIISSKEYIYNASSVSSESDGWQEIGDENAWDTKGSASQALVDAKDYTDDEIATLSGSASATSGYAITGISESNGIISKTGEIKIPTDNAELTNGASYATTSEVNTAINNAIFGLIDTVYTAA